jgi:outer membrane protein TolC
LTLQAAIEHALSANLDLQIERVAPEISEWNIVSAQGTFDPALTGSLRYENMREPLALERAELLGPTTLETQQLRSVLSLVGTLHTGTRYELSVFDTRTSGTLATGGIHTGTSSLTLTQPLLKDFGRSNTVALRVARKDRQIAIEQTAGRVMDIVSDVSRAYYELIFALEDHAAKLEDLQRAKALLADNRTRVEVGVMSPLDVTQAEAGAAEREEAVIVAARGIIERENALKRLISADVRTLIGVSLRPAEALPGEPVATDVAQSTRVALAGRPDIKQARHDIERRGLVRAFTRNQSFPEVNLETSYGLNARGDNAREFATNLSARDHPAWSVGLTATMPLGNRQADAAHRIAKLEEERAGLSLRKLEQDIVVEVDNAVGQVQTNAKRVEATRVARRLAEESLAAEESRLRAGASTSFLVLQAQSQLAAARSAEIRARADFGASLVDLARVEGTTMEKHHITLAD